MAGSSMHDDVGGALTFNHGLFCDILSVLRRHDVATLQVILDEFGSLDGHANLIRGQSDRYVNPTNFPLIAMDEVFALMVTTRYRFSIFVHANVETYLRVARLFLEQYGDVDHLLETMHVRYRHKENMLPVAGYLDITARCRSRNALTSIENLVVTTIYAIMVNKCATKLSLCATKLDLRATELDLRATKLDEHWDEFVRAAITEFVCRLYSATPRDFKVVSESAAYKPVIVVRRIGTDSGKNLYLTHNLDVLKTDMELKIGECRDALWNKIHLSADDELAYMIWRVWTIFRDRRDELRKICRGIITDL